MSGTNCTIPFSQFKKRIDNPSSSTGIVSYWMKRTMDFERIVSSSHSSTYRLHRTQSKQPNSSILATTRVPYPRSRYTNNKNQKQSKTNNDATKEAAGSIHNIQKVVASGVFKLFPVSASMHDFATSNLLVNHTVFSLVKVSLSLKFFLI